MNFQLSSSFGGIALGDAAAHWVVVPLRYVASLKGRLGWQGLRADEYTENGPLLVSSEHFVGDRIDWDKCNHVTKDRFGAAPDIQLRRYDVLLMKDGAAMGKLAYVEALPGPACLNSHLVVIRPLDSRLDSKFLYFLLASPLFERFLEVEKAGTTFFGISQASLERFACPLPPVHEQQQISAWLKRELLKGDSLVTEQHRLIALLKEKRQALISHAVTKGLNPDAPMKPSGVEWLGDVPAHWEYAALTRIARRVVVGIAEAATHAYVDEGVPILRSTNIRSGRITGEILFLNPTFAGDRDSKRMAAGDLVTVRTGNAGVTAVVPQEFDGCQCFTMLITSLNNSESSEFYCYWMNSLSAQCYFSLEGWGTAQVNISVPVLKALPVPIPPPSEQLAIVAFLNHETAKLDALTTEAQGAIDLLEERRAALISAAVTGHIDVRGLVEVEVA